MPIDKLTPKYLSSDSDSKFAAKNTMLDAINLYIGGDDSDSSLNGGDGVLKNVKGNLEVVGSDHLPANSVVLGKVEDTKAKLLYLFVWAPSGIQHSVWVYDPLGRLPDAVENSLRLVYESNQFNFPQDGFVKADIVYSSSREDATREQFDSLGSDFEKDAIIYFTDGVNEPRKINAYRALVSSGSNINGATSENPFPETDFITACLKAPLKPVTFKFDNDSDRSVSNFKVSSGFQFAYQHIYKDGGESAISSYSDVAFSPSVLSQGAATYRNHDFYNYCLLSLPVPGPEVFALRVLARQGVAGNFLVVDEIKNEDFNTEYKFYNDRILTGVSSDEVNKQFDSLPRKAQAQAVSNNRLMYGNYEDGYENVKASCRVTLKHLERPEDFQDYNIEVKPFLGYATDEQSMAPYLGDLTPKGRSSGIYVNTSSLPSSMVSGSTVNFTLKISPDNNWHLYHPFGVSQSRRVGVTDTATEDTQFNGVNTDFTTTSPEMAAGGIANLSWAPGEGSSAVGKKTISGGIIQPLSVETFTETNHIKVSSTNNNPTAGSFKWKVLDFQNPNTDEDSENQIPQIIPSEIPEVLDNVAVGINAAAPFIIQSQPMTFSVGFMLAEDVPNNFASIVALTLKEMLVSEYGPNHSEFEQDGFDGLTHYGLFDPDSLHRSRAATYDINHGLNGGELIPAPFIGQSNTLGSPNSELNKLISPVMTSEHGPAEVVSGIIVNKAKPVFKFKKVKENEQPENLYGQGLDDFSPNSTEFGLNLFLESLSKFDESGNPYELELTTCIRATRRYQMTTSYAASQNGFAQPRLSWVTLPQSDEFSEDNVFLGTFGVSASQIGINSSAGLTSMTTGADGQVTFTANAAGAWRYQVGRAIIDSTSLFHGDMVFNSQITENGYTRMSLLCLVDGEGGPGGGKSRGGGGNDYDDLSLDKQGSITCTPQVAYLNGQDRYIWFSGNLFYDGVITVAKYNSPNLNINIDEGDLNSPSLQATTLPLVQNPFIQDSPSYFDLYPDPIGTTGGSLDASSVNFKRNHGHVEIQISDLNVEFENTDSRTTFKTSAYHDFGIVYYDERGRHGFVNHLSLRYRH